MSYKCGCVSSDSFGSFYSPRCQVKQLITRYESQTTDKQSLALCLSGSTIQNGREKTNDRSISCSVYWYTRNEATTPPINNNAESEYMHTHAHTKWSEHWIDHLDPIYDYLYGFLTVLQCEIRFLELIFIWVSKSFAHGFACHYIWNLTNHCWREEQKKPGWW